MRATWILLALLPAAGGAADLGSTLAVLQAEVKPDEAMRHMRAVYATDRWFTFPKFQETSEYLRRAMREAGLEQVEVLSAPADGISRAGFWTMPTAWDVKDARLELEDGTVLADYRTVPASLGMWSGATIAPGVLAELVELKTSDPAEIEKLDLRRKLVLTNKNPAELKWILARKGALGAVNAFTENPALEEGRQWINAWGDNGWAFTRESTPLLCFSLAPKQAALVRQRLKERGAVLVKATVNSRYYPGVYPYVTGVLPGTEPGEEVLTLGHTSEQGAQDNATGVAAMLEAMAALRRLIAAGRLPRPRRTIRMLAMGEMYGSMHYIATHQDRIHHTIAAMCLDTPAASYELPGTEYTFYLNPHAGASFIDAFVLRLAADYFARIGRPFHAKPYMAGTDSYLGEPTIGVPTAWPYSGSGVHTHHNSEDTPDRVDARSLRDISVVTASFLYFLGSAGPAEAGWLAEVAAQRGAAELRDSIKPFDARVAACTTRAELGRLLHDARERIEYLRERHGQALHSVERVAPGVALEPGRRHLDDAARETLAGFEQRVNARAAQLRLQAPIRPLAPPSDGQLQEAARIVVRRKRFGTIPLDDLATDQREGYPSGAWAPVPITALYWCDGRRNLAEVIRRTRLELGPAQFDFVGYFRFLERHGYVEFVRPEAASR